MKMGTKVIIDCDVGVDDALALILAFHSPELGGESDHRSERKCPIRYGI